MADTIMRPTTPPSPTIDELFGDHEPDIFEGQLKAWVLSPQPWTKLSGVHPELRIRVWRIITAMAVMGFQVMVVSGLRTELEQAADYAKGRRGKAGEKIVTHKNGSTSRSKHQCAVPPSRYAGVYCTAVDMVFVGADLRPSWEEHWPWSLLGAVAKSQGLVWGGDWPTFRDRPHVELFE